jgi:hypothetical protein
MTITETIRGDWMPVAGFDLYEVSPRGEVRNRRRMRPLSPGRSSNSYLLVTLYRNGQRFNRTIHSLVAAAYVAGQFEGAVVRHRNNETHDNRAENLLWGTQSDNEQDKVASGRHPQKSKTHCPQRHPYDKANTIHRRGARECRTCRQARNRKAAE